MEIEGITGMDEAIASLNAALDTVLHQLLHSDAFPVEEQIARARQLEQLQDRWSQINLQILTGLDRSDAATALCQGNLARVLTSALRISKAEANRRVHAYEQLGPRRSMLGEELGPVRPLVAAAVAAGEVSMEKALIITRALTPIDRAGFDPADIAAGEKLLVDDATIFNPEELRILTQRVVDAIHPDGTTPNDELNHDRRWFELKPTTDGAYTGKFRLTAECGAKLATLLRPLSTPRVDYPHRNTTTDPGADPDTSTDTATDTASTGGDEADTRARRARVIDERTFGQRQHDAFNDLCDRLLREGTVRENGTDGPPVTVIVTIDAHDLTHRTGHATTTTGAQLSTDTVVRMANQADVFTVMLDQHGVPLQLARRKRCATRHQTMALIARDIGCSFPGCTHPADYCERHHIIPWIDGGMTDLNNLTLLCVYHHHNFLQRGWTVRMNHQGLPEWLAPQWVDPQQKPLINHRIRAAHQRR